MTTTQTWRLLRGRPASAAWQMAVDEAVSVSVRKHRAPPTLRLYEWLHPSLTLGFFQKIRDEVELDLCGQLDIDVVRRITGGRAILHNPDELTYGFSSPLMPPFNEGLHPSYTRISEALIYGLRLLGLEARMSGRIAPAASRSGNPVCFQTLSFAEASVGGRKIIGSAQKRWPDGLLQQGAIPLSIDFDRLYTLFRFPSETEKTNARQRAPEKMAGLRDFLPSLDKKTLLDAICKGFEVSFEINLKPGELTDEETKRAEELVTTRYAHPGWNFRR